MSIIFDNFDEFKEFAVQSGLFVEKYRYDVMAEERESERNKQNEIKERAETDFLECRSQYQRQIEIAKQTISNLQDRVEEGVQARLHAEKHLSFLFSNLTKEQQKDFLETRFSDKVQRVKFIRTIFGYDIVAAKAFVELVEDLYTVPPLPSNEAEGLVEYLENISTNES